MIGLVEAALALFILFRLYHARDRRRWMTVAGCVACIGPLAMLLPERTIRRPIAAELKALRVARADTLSFDRREIPLHITVDGITSAQHAMLSQVDVRFTLTSGQIVHVVQQYYLPISLGDSVPTPFPLRWIGHSGLPTVAATLLVHPSDDERARLARGVVAVSVEGELTVNEPAFVGVMPLKRGAQLNVGNRRILVDSVRFTGHDVHARVYTSAPDGVGMPLSLDPYLMNGPRFALVNEKRMEAIGIPGAGFAGRNFWLVMPGMSMSEQTYGLSLRSPMQSSMERVEVSPNGTTRFSTPVQSYSPQPLPVDGEWLRDTKLLVFDWRARGAFHVRGATRFQ